MPGPTYTFTADTPNSADPMNVTQPLILANFQAINELITVNHVGFNLPGTSGKHNSLTMQIQSSNPGTASTDIAFFPKVTGSPNPAELFYQYQNNGTVVQLTPTSNSGGGGSASATSGTGTAAGLPFGWCQFPSGIIMKWGTVAWTSTGLYNLPTGGGVPQYTQSIAYVQATLLGPTSGASTSTPSNFANTVNSYAYGLTQIGLFTGRTSVNIYYLCIGL